MTKLQEFITADAPSLSLQVKFLHAEHRSSKESLYGLKFPVHDDAIARRDTGNVQRLPESIWMLAHKIVAFSQNYIQQAKWNNDLLNWLFITEPWWSLEYKDYATYASLFPKTDWFTAMETLSMAHRAVTKQVESEKFAAENHAVLHFLADSRRFTETMYRRL